MKIISFNIWGGTMGQPLFDFLKQHAKDTDVFCFQEVFQAGVDAPAMSSEARMYLLDELQEILPDFRYYFDIKSSGHDYEKLVPWKLDFGKAIFVQKTHDVVAHGWEVYMNTAGYINTAPQEGLVGVQSVSIQKDQGLLHIVHVHGISKPGQKLDTPERLHQSQSMVKYIGALPKGDIVLCGDFNLMPNTESIRIVEKSGLRNLITEYNITNTRNEVSWAKFKGQELQHFADYTFVSPSIKVINFEVPYNEISDHLPMIIELSI